ncbi:MAG: hypothetical protein AAF433_01975 [Bacteroidota bacterium]
MDPTLLIMWTGFILAGYAVVGNDSIQTLGTFLASNERRPWWVLWLFAGSILTFTLVYGWYYYGGDVSYERLQVLIKDGENAGSLRYPSPVDMPEFGWPYLLPPLVLMILTRTGIPVSTSFLILTFFAPKGLMSMTMKSILGYALAFCVAILLWQLITRFADRKFLANPIKPQERRVWTVLQWASTGFLWGQWLIQDFANIYVYLPRSINGAELAISLAILLTMLAIIFYSKGGAIQKIVKAKTNTVDVRSATIIDFTYSIVLLFFKEFSNVPMSTTWVFLGLLAGREIAIRYRLELEAEPSDVQRAPLMHSMGLGLNVVLLGLIGYVVYLRDAVSDLIIIVLAAFMIARAAVAYYETSSGQLDLKGAFRNILSDLAKVAFGLAISVALVYIMKWITGGAIG